MMTSQYQQRIKWLQLLTEKQLLELMYDIGDLVTIIHIYDAAWHYIEEAKGIQEIKQ